MAQVTTGVATVLFASPSTGQRVTPRDQHVTSRDTRYRDVATYIVRAVLTAFKYYYYYGSFLGKYLS